MGLLVAPGAMFPVANDPSSAVTLCTMESPLNHATVWPAVTVPGLGENDWLPFCPVMVIVMLAPVPGPGLGMGDGDVGLNMLLLPQAANVTASASAPNVTVSLEFMVSPSSRSVAAWRP